MTKYISFLLLTFLLFSCTQKEETIKATYSAISQSVYASGTIKAKSQYQATSTVAGIINDIFVKEGDTVKKGQAILSISNDAQRWTKQNAELAAQFADLATNQDKLNDAKAMIDLAAIKLKNDSLLYFRQKALYEQQVGAKVELESRELAYANSKTAYNSALIKYNDLKRQLALSSSQSKNNLLIAGKQESDYTLKSEMNGIVYDVLKEKGELVNQQTPLAIIGESGEFVLEMQIDEYDIFKIQLGQKVLVSMDSYKGKAFEARVTKIDPIMNERSKTFKVEAEFTNGPAKIYPNISFEASIVIETKEKALLLPRSYVLNDSIVLNGTGDSIHVKTGLRDYTMIEILSGISDKDEIKKPF